MILTAKFRSLYVKESEILEWSESGVWNFAKTESENLERSKLESDILPPTPQPCLQSRAAYVFFFTLSKDKAR